MIPISHEEELVALADKRINLAEQYAKARNLYGQAKFEIDVIYASEISNINNIKKNAGYETGLIFLMATNSGVRQIYNDLIIQQNNYKGLDRLIDAVAAKQSNIQSIMKNNRMND